MNGNYSPQLLFLGGDEEAQCPGTYGRKCSSQDWIIPDFGMTHVGFSMVSCTLSVVGSLLTIAPYTLWKDVRTGMRRIITFLAVADFFTASSYLMGSLNYIVYEHSREDTDISCRRFYSVCQIQSFISSWASVSSFLWTTLFALYLYFNISKGDTKQMDRYFPLYHMITWGVPFLFMFPLLVNGDLGYSVFATGGWCFVKGDKAAAHSPYRQYHLSFETIIAILLGGKAIEIFTYVWITLLFCIMYYKIHKRKSQSRSRETVQIEIVSNLLRQVEKKLYAIPIAFIMLRIWGTLQFVISIVVFNNHTIDSTGCLPKYIFYIYFALGIIQSVGDGGQGWCNFLLYVLWSQKIRERMIINPFRVCCLEVTKYFASSSPPSENYGIINEVDEPSTSSRLFRRNMYLDFLNSAGEESRLLGSSEIKQYSDTSGPPA